MGKITKSVQDKHKETLSPWLKGYVEAAASAPLPLIPQHLDRFPTKWPFPRGDLYHWIPLLNRFDNILESFCRIYNLNDGPQMRDFECDLLLGGASVDYCDEPWNRDRLAELGYKHDGDCQFIITVLKFSTMLLEHCGNRSIYASSHHLNDLLHSSYINVIYATLEVGMELSQRYQASVKRMSPPSRQVSNALLASHYNIELERVQCLAQPFVKTPIVKLADPAPATPSVTTASKGKEKMPSPSQKNVTSMYANDLVSIATTNPSDEGRWNGWGDVKVVYYPKTESAEASSHEAPATDHDNPTMPATPTPLRRSTIVASQQTPRSSKQGPPDEGASQRTPTVGHEENSPAGPKVLEVPQSLLLSTSVYELLQRCPPDMPKSSRYEYLHRIRIGKALLGSAETRQQALAVRLLAIINLAYIHPEQTFIEKALKQDNDEPRRYQLVYQLAELIHPSADGSNGTPVWLQSLALALLEAISNFHVKYPDVLSALNANVNHGVLLYVIRKAVVGMRDTSDDDSDKDTPEDEWRNNLFSLTLHMAMQSRVGQEMITAGLMEILIEILNLRSEVAARNHSMVLAFLDGLIYGYQGGFTSFINAAGLDSVAKLIVDTESQTRTLVAAGKGTRPDLRTNVVDYEIPFFQQQTLKWLLKFIHHVMANSFAYGGNTDRLLRNLVDNSQLLAAVRSIIESRKLFGSVVWTNACLAVSDFINNDPTSFAAISESGLIKGFLEALTGRPVVAEVPAETSSEHRHNETDDDDEDPSSPARSEDSAVFEDDVRTHPPTQAMLEAPREGRLAGGILPSGEAMGMIPTVLNSICLNSSGMRMVVRSRAIESFFEIFESAEHVSCMQTDQDLAANIGGSFDELARHHPTLRPAISNAVLDMVARVIHLARTKAKAGWGVKLEVTDPQGNLLTADDTLLSDRGPESATEKGKGTAASDVDMVDADTPQEATSSSSLSPSSKPHPAQKAYSDITPYVSSVAFFLNALIGNSHLKSTFIGHNGIELLFDLLESGSLPADFFDGYHSRMVIQVVATLLESAQILGLPSLLNRIQVNIDILKPLISTEGSHPFFAPFLIPDLSLVNESGDWDQAILRKVAKGTPIVKALLNLQVLVKILYQSFPFSSRQGTATLPPVNVYDHYGRLIKSLGPLLRGVLTEEMSMATIVPHNWTPQALTQSLAAKADGSASANNSSKPAASGAEDKGDTTAASGVASTSGSSSRLKPPTDEELATAQFRNYATLRELLHSLMPSTLPFFQTIGKALLLRRDRDRNDYIRSRHLSIAEALAETILEQLKPLDPGEVTVKNFHHWIIMLHTVHEMLIDPTRQNDRASVHIIVPVLVAFKEHGGLETLNKMMEHFVEEITNGPSDGDESSKPKLAEVGLNKILDIYSLIVYGKEINESIVQTQLVPTGLSRGPEQAHQLIVELRMSILPVARKLWESKLVEDSPSSVSSKIVNILKGISMADHEANAWRRSEKTPVPTVFKNRADVRFDWRQYTDLVKTLARDYDDEDLAREAVYRANGKDDDANAYCTAHQKGYGGERNPIPSEDAFQDTPPRDESRDQTPAFSVPDLVPDSMALDSLPDINTLLAGGEVTGDAVLALTSQASRIFNSTRPAAEGASDPATTSADSESRPDSASAPGQSQESVSATVNTITKDDLDEERTKLAEDLIDRCMVVARLHPDTVFEIAELIQETLLQTPGGNTRRTEIGEAFAKELSGFAVLDQESMKANGRAIAAYAHLLSLLLQDKNFYKYTAKALKESAGNYLSFLIMPTHGSSEELPPWIPYVLLIFEILLVDDEQPVEVKWKPPTDESPVEAPVWQERDTNLSDTQRLALLGHIMDMLPRIGKEESLALSVLRILVILTRDHAAAKTVGERKNLQRLFVMAKQLCGVGSVRLNQTRISDSIIILLRHIIEDEDTIRNMMRSEIRLYMENQQRHPRSTEIPIYLRNLTPVALRSPKVFIEVTTELIRLKGWGTPDRQYTLALKEQSPAAPAEAAKDASVGSTVQATEDLTINDVKSSTEPGDKEMADAPKTPASELKRPVLENPDGVVHFLLCELLNYREVDDKEPLNLSATEPKGTGEPPRPGSDAASSSSSPEQQPSEKDKDKKAPKSNFKPEDHPIFVYRCFLLNCLSELLQCFNRAKVEFINFKRNAPIQTHTPVKPRTSVLNYLINDLLCLNNAGGTVDSVVLKKKAATANHVQAMLVALVARTSEKPVDRRQGVFEYEDGSDLFFVRRFVLDTILRAYKEASVPSESFEIRYAKMLCLADLMSQMIGERDKDTPNNPRGLDPSVVPSQMQLRRLMIEKGYLNALTASIAEVDLTFPNVKRTIKYILRVLRALTKTVILLGQSGIYPPATTNQPEDDIISNSSISDLDDDREETPDLYRNSTLGMLEPGREDDFSEDSEDDDEEMYDDGEYGDEMDYGDDMSDDAEEIVSDEDEELGEMGEIEGLPGNAGVVEVIMGENDDDDDEDDMDEDDDEEPGDEDDDDDDEDDDDDVGSEDMEDVEDQIEIVDGEGNPMEDDGASGWESETDEEEGEDGEEIDYQGEAQDLAEQLGIEGDQIGRFVPMHAGVAADDLDGEDIQAFEDHYIDDGAEEDDEEEEDEVDEEEFFYDQYRDDHAVPTMPAGLGWDTLVVDHSHRHRPMRGHGSFPAAPFMIGGPRDTIGDFRSYAHHNRSRATANNADYGVNPLLRRNNNGTNQGEPSTRSTNNNQTLRFGPLGPFSSSLDGPLAFINNLVQALPINGRGGLSFQITASGPHGEVRELNFGNLTARETHREHRSEARREATLEPQSVVAFVAEQSFERWDEESQVIFGNTCHEKSARLYNGVLGNLAPYAVQYEKEQQAKAQEEKRKAEEERKKREENERREREAKEAEEKAAREKKEAEERAEREAAEATESADATVAQAEQEAAETHDAEEDDAESQAMEGVETHAGDDENENESAAAQRIVTTIRGGETVDVTELGIDPEYLAALPEEFREEVIAQTVSTRRSQAREQADNEGENTEVFQEFLEALPDELRMEIIQQERQERRRREREEARRVQATSVGQDNGPSDMDPASILLTFPPALREQVLIEQGDELMDHLPPELAAEARAIAQRHNLSLHRTPPVITRTREPARQVEASGANDSKSPRRTIVQILDKAGVATLLRLMFVTQQGSIRNYLFEVFAYVCENRQNRLEVVSNLLQILQEGSIDMDAVERSFGQLSLKAKQPKDKDPKTPGTLKRTLTNVSVGNQILNNSEVSPLLVVQQCLDLLVELSTKNLHVPSLFLTEHETVASTLKRSVTNRKGKGKDISAKAQKYAINSLLSLLDRTLVMESSSVMQLLADLLNRVTAPLQAIERRRKEAEEEAKKTEAEQPPAASQEDAGTAGESASAAQQSEAQPAADAPAPAAEEGSAAKDKEDAKADEKKPRQLTPPTIPEHNLKLVINIFVARECSSKTFQNTIATIKNLSNIPNAKRVFGEELVRQARVLSENILTDLDDLLPHINKAETGTEIQGVALAKFSPGASEQNKLLRVLTALDHLFDSNKGKSSEKVAEGESAEDLLGSLYWNPTFHVMWEKLSVCLSAIRKRENMLNVATILLPLIESLMVVCKNTTLGDAPLSTGAATKDMLLSSPPPEDRIAGLFFTFTEEHRRILNELVRHNPKLMSGTFSLLVKNPKVLEFDNKRNYFNRSVHSKSGHQTRPSFPPLQLSVRREHVFHDSFKSLYFKTGDEMKFGKLSIRFHGEEGVDAGGVTREWFQVLARQMFDPNYVLFTPVSSDRTTFHPNKLSAINDEHLMFFKFIGRIIGKALYEGRVLDCHFSRAVYKRILGKPVSVKDMESFDPDYYKSLVWMLENDITDIIVDTFSVEDDEFGVTKVIDLIENGRNIPVTEENKHDYVRLIVEHKLLSSVKEQMENFLKGFHDIVPVDLIAIFNEQELELLISGLPDIDIDDWKGNTEYHNYTAASPQIQWFWRAVRSFDKEERAKLLQFVTGTSKVPLNGFRELEGMNGINRFNIHRDYGNKNRLPSSHTCFNQLDLPEYESYDALRSQVLKAITAGSDYFGFA